MKTLSVRLTSTIAAAALVICVGSLHAQSRAISVDPAKLIVVDCLLPGKVIKQGGRSITIGPSRPARLTATVCEIRGGRYVAYDRANYKTALEFWLPEAELGDKAAQAYVAEIYEKGLGTTPDYQLAAEWYGKAAAQRHQGAQLSLAYLYEQGLGVSRDQVKALNLYREAMGIKNDDLTYVSDVTAAKDEAQRVIDSLTVQLERQSQSLESLGKELAFTRDKLEERRFDLEATRFELANLQTELVELQRVASAPARAAELERLEAQIRDRERQLAWRTREVAELEAQSATQRAEWARTIEVAALREASLQERIGEPGSDTNLLRTELATVRDSLRDSELRVAELTGVLAEERAQLAGEREDFINRGTADSVEQQRQLAAREARISEQQDQITALEARQREYLKTIGELQDQEHARRQAQDADTQTVRAQLAAAEQRRVETEHQVAELKTQLRQGNLRIQIERQQLEKLQQAVEQGQRAKIEELRQELAAREARVDEQEVLIEAFEKRSAEYARQIAQLSSAGPTVAMRGPNVGESTSVPVAPNKRRSLDLGTYHALIIGNNDYQSMPSLATALNDARALEAVLKDKYGFKTRLIANATRVDILSALNEYAETLEADESLLIYYAGHGQLDQRNQRSYWLPVNADPNEMTEWISDQMLTDLIELIQARHVLVVADSCYSGTMTKSATHRTGTATGEQEAELARLKVLAALRSRTVLTSGGDQPVLDGGGGTHSIFAKHFIEALKRNDRILEGSVLYSALYAPVHDAAAQFRVEQSPRYSVLAGADHFNGEFLFVPLT